MQKRSLMQQLHAHLHGMFLFLNQNWMRHWLQVHCQMRKFGVLLKIFSYKPRTHLNFLPVHM
jgi:hypothetical protein